MDNKIILRRTAKSIRNRINMDLISQLILLNIKDMSLYKSAKNIMIYYPIKNEINLLPLTDTDKQFYLPRVSGENIECCKYNKNAELCRSSLNVPEPLSPSVSTDILDLIFVPALAVNEQGYRLGYGKGYYDRFLKTCSAKTIVVVPEELIFKCSFEEEHDVPCDIIITQKKASIERG